MPDQTPKARGAWKFDGFAVAMIAVGALILTLCGSCTSYFAGAALWDMIAHGNAGGNLVVLFVAGVIGGIPTAGGIALFLLGFDRAQQGRKPPKPPSPPTTSY
jgi:hypothetical protein